MKTKTKRRKLFKVCKVTRWPSEADRLRGYLYEAGEAMADYIAANLVLTAAGMKDKGDPVAAAKLIYKIIGEYPQRETFDIILHKESDYGQRMKDYKRKNSN